MSKLFQKHCVACDGETPPFTVAEISKFKSQISNEWNVIDDHGIKKLRRYFKFKNFKQAIEFINKVGEIAEAQGHHPEIQFGWGHATITWWTHAIGGLFSNDFIMAAKTDEIAPPQK